MLSYRNTKYNLQIRNSTLQAPSQLKSNLLNKLKQTQRGISTSPQLKTEIEQHILQLSSIQKTSTTTIDNKINGTWRLLWTTEKETLFILKNAQFFGTTGGEAYQIIDLGTNRLQNVIQFPPEGRFVVDSTAEIGENSRVNFQFQSAKLRVFGRDVPNPPYGKGWFDTLYIDDEIRISYDSRKDYLITAFESEPTFF
eukprot:TRINITY_DN7196_c0_g1_i4.p1 TRINITY_DN7196_c0_g1~~TRINITY_DN7196_c0_g1_i4.p1  ORF type:complete len:197 (-),score=7.63 TRINITY_DN7196_c0_g1_i4:286-876(-)